MCDAIEFPDVTPEAWNAIEQRLVALNLDISAEELAADAGEATIKGCKIDWKYADGKLTVWCSKKPMLYPCGPINDKIREAFAARV